MCLRMCPIRRIRIELRTDAGKTQLHAGAAVPQQRGRQPHDEDVSIWMHRGFHLDRHTVENEAAIEPAGPQIELLARVAELREGRHASIRTHQMQPDAPEIEAM